MRDYLAAAGANKFQSNRDFKKRPGRTKNEIKIKASGERAANECGSSETGVRSSDLRRPVSAFQSRVMTFYDSQAGGVANISRENNTKRKVDTQNGMNGVK